MAKKPFARDWVHVAAEVVYSKELNLWYNQKTQTAYDETSARHNGIIGLGKQLKEMIQ